VIRRDTHTRRAEAAFSFGSEYIHRVRHEPAHGVALSIHITPPARDPLDYELGPDGIIRTV
jgi:hypothetical protein